MRLCFLIAGMGIALAAFVSSVSAAETRGLSVKLRASEATDAPIVETVELYSKSYALVIGNDIYRNRAWPRLSQAVNDAQKVAAALEAKGFEVTLKTNLDASALSGAFEDFFIDKGADPDARLFVWYAGHGHTDTRGEGYLIPVDGVAERERKRFLRTALSLRDFGKYVRLAESKHVLTIFDSCFSGTIFKVGRSTPPPAITKVTTRAVRQFLTSGDRDQQVSDDGTFAKLFVDAVSGRNRADSNADGYLTGSEIGAFLTYEISNYSRNDQTPRFGPLRDPAFSQGDFVFQLASVAPARKVSKSGGGQTPEMLFWQSIEDSKNPASFDAYLAQYPNGAFAALALVKLDELKRTKTASLSPPSFTVDALDETLVVLRNANVREYPTATAEKIATLATGKTVEVTGKTRFEGKDWYRVAVSGRAAYVFGALLGEASPKLKPVVGVYPKRKAPGETFRDCGDCPEMVVIPSGSFRMGDLSGAGQDDEKPVHDVRIGYSFAVGKYEVTRGEFARFVSETNHDAGDKCRTYESGKWDWRAGKTWRDPGFSQTDRDPVACVNWKDAKAYIDWMSGKTGESYRLLSESEWEYMVRSGSRSRYPFGDSESALCGYGNAADQSTDFKWRNKSCSDGIGKKTAPVGSYKANEFGVHDTVGNVWEWVEDCWHGSYSGAPSNGNAWTSGGDCAKRVLRGGSWSITPRTLRSAYRGRYVTTERNFSIGFRIARTLSR